MSPTTAQHIATRAAELDTALALEGYALVLNEHEAAAAMRLSTRTLRRLVARGALRRAGGAGVRYLRRDVARVLAN